MPWVLCEKQLNPNITIIFCSFFIVTLYITTDSKLHIILIQSVGSVKIKAVLFLGGEMNREDPP